jgi:hypothetical protein
MAGVTFSKLSGKTESFYKAVEGVLTEIISDEGKSLNKHDEVLKGIFAMKTSNKFGERAGGRTSFGNMKPMSEGGVFAKDEIEEGYAKLAIHEPYGLAFTTTHDMVADDNLDDAKMAASEMMDTYKRSRLVAGTNFLVTEGSTYTYEGKTYDKTTGDGKGFFATDHLMKKSATTQSNVFTNPFGTDDNMLNRLAVLGRNFKNDSGISIGLTFDTIIIPSNCYALEKTIKSIMASNQIVGSANNDVNIQKGKWNLIVDHMWEAASGAEPYILMASEAQKKYGALRWITREELDVRNWIDENTRNLEWSGRCRFSIMPYMWQGFVLGGASVGTTLS